MAAGTAYAKRYASGFTDLDGSKPVDAAFLNAVETALLQLIGAAPTADGQVAQWDNANTRFGPALLLNKNIDPAAAIAKSKLDFTGANGIVNADIAGAAAIDSSKINGLPIYYRKTTSKTVSNSVAETDLLNGEVTIAANAMGTTKTLRLTAFGDWKQNSGAATDVPRFKLKLGATTIWDSNIVGTNVVANSATRIPWRIQAEIMNLGLTNSQWATIVGFAEIGGTALAIVAPATGEGQTSTRMYNATSAAYVDYLGANSSAEDTTAAKTLVLSVILPVASANTDIVLKSALVEII